jgi:hypothetical protein
MHVYSWTPFFFKKEKQVLCSRSLVSSSDHAAPPMWTDSKIYTLLNSKINVIILLGLTHATYLTLSYWLATLVTVHMDEFAPVCKFTYMQNNLHMCKFGHENGALVKGVLSNVFFHTCDRCICISWMHDATTCWDGWCIYFFKGKFGLKLISKI